MKSITTPKTGFAAMIVAASSLAAAPAEAMLIRYELSSTPVVDCGSAAHGLWTNGNSYGGSCGQYFDIQEDSYLEIDKADLNNIVGTLIGTAINPHGFRAEMNFALSDWADTYTPYKKEGGPTYDPNLDDPDIDFFKLIDGTVKIFDPSDALTDTFTTNSIPFVEKGNTGQYFVFQYGVDGKGQNAKDPNSQGASAWIIMNDGSGHWDLNLNTKKVPEPATIALLGAGLVGLGVMTRRRRNSNA